MALEESVCEGGVILEVFLIFSVEVSGFVGVITLTLRLVIIVAEAFRLLLH